jgi:hypothetical protein
MLGAGSRASPRFLPASKEYKTCPPSSGKGVYLWGTVAAHPSMSEDFVFLLAGTGILILYLVFSAMTEMGTKWPWRK